MKDEEKKGELKRLGVGGRTSKERRELLRRARANEDGRYFDPWN